MKKASILALLTVAALPLSACVENANTGSNSTDGKDGAIEVTAKSDSCEASKDSAESGNQTFTIKNEGKEVTEFYVLANDGLRVIAEKENIAPGTTAELIVPLEPGDYFTACKPGLRGPNVGQAKFTVTGQPIEVDASDQERFDKAVEDYIAYVKNEVAELVPATTEFANAYKNGDDEKAKEMYPNVRVHYERIEPIAEALGILDPRIDYREVDYIAEAEELKKDDETFTEWLGFHRIEKDLWPPAESDKNADGTPAREGWEPSDEKKRAEIADALIADVEQLDATVRDENFIKDNDITIATVSNGAMALLEEIAANKITGEENWWSHKDLYDFQSNLQGSRIAFDLVKDIAVERGEEGKKLVEDIEKRYDDLQEQLDEYGSLEAGFKDYSEVDAGEQQKLTRSLDALREELSRLTGTVLGI
ncbi:iron uptake system protein EfeO [Corynebacterium aquatimens]|uniref:Iron uptake system component EfeO n=1 Tax=Corynebacterium aquatimens TaxID=1190508 RepID=A0A931GTV9_9CORY|nr:iron uptake system protein EfeO [Corynebacterium aquatimens]MBG6122190.1 iron uptake system component EfeO [Corynebacterium aquatimens]WJY65269.1 Efem/EfeO family lipoprotein precursor [Corynebacterium aquatimens]